MASGIHNKNPGFLVHHVMIMGIQTSQILYRKRPKIGTANMQRGKMNFIMHPPPASGCLLKLIFTLCMLSLTRGEVHHLLAKIVLPRGVVNYLGEGVLVGGA